MISRNIKSNRGFTLIEVVVVITNIALLSAILVPLVGRQIEDAKVARAKNECQIIAASLQKFYGDLGVFPARGPIPAGAAAFMNKTTRLVSGTARYTVTNGTVGTNYGYTGNSNDDWYDDAFTGLVYIDIFDHHLVENKPQGNSTYSYDSTGEACWKGPYLASVGDDPWGHHYVCNIDAAYTGSNVVCVVISAGPNGYFDTTVDPAATTAGPSGDDIWAVVASRQ